MASASENQTHQGDDSKEITLIDIFYCDDDRLNSLTSQVFHGSIQEVLETIENSKTEKVTNRANVGFTRALGFSFVAEDIENSNRAMQHKKVPYDELALRLLKKLEISPKVFSLDEFFSRLDILQGEVSLINYKKFSEMIPLAQKVPSILDPKLKELEDCRSTLKYLQSKGDKSKCKNEVNKLKEKIADLEFETRTVKATIEGLDIVRIIMPQGFGFELKMNDGDVFTGFLKSDYLTDSEEIIFNNYGENLPDKWNILGIVDYKTQKYKANSLSPLSNLLKVSDEIKSSLVNQKTKGTIIPILIYRELNVPD